MKSRFNTEFFKKNTTYNNDNHKAKQYTNTLEEIQQEMLYIQNYKMYHEKLKWTPREGTNSPWIGRAGIIKISPPS